MDFSKMDGFVNVTCNPEIHRGSYERFTKNSVITNDCSVAQVQLVSLGTHQHIHVHSFEISHS